MLQCPIVERLTNALMYNGRNNGKKLLAVRIIKHTLEIIHLTTDQNPIQVLVNAIMNSGCREDSTRIGSGGVVRRQAVDCSPLRRVNQAIYLLTTGVRRLALRLFCCHTLVVSTQGTGHAGIEATRFQVLTCAALFCGGRHGRPRSVASRRSPNAWLMS